MHQRIAGAPFYPRLRGDGARRDRAGTRERRCLMSHLYVGSSSTDHLRWGFENPPSFSSQRRASALFTAGTRGLLQQDFCS
ncbi:unnamed protein product [Arctogadus glacialis]